MRWNNDASFHGPPSNNFHQYLSPPTVVGGLFCYTTFADYTACIDSMLKFSRDVNSWEKVHTVPYILVPIPMYVEYVYTIKRRCVVSQGLLGARGGKTNDAVRVTSGTGIHTYHKGTGMNMVKNNSR